MRRDLGFGPCEECARARALSLSLSLFVCESWKSFEGKMKVALVLRLKLVILRSTCN